MNWPTRSRCSTVAARVACSSRANCSSSSAGTISSVSTRAAKCASKSYKGRAAGKTSGTSRRVSPPACWTLVSNCWAFDSAGNWKTLPSSDCTTTGGLARADISSHLLARDRVQVPVALRDLLPDVGRLGIERVAHVLEAAPAVALQFPEPRDLADLLADRLEGVGHLSRAPERDVAAVRIAGGDLLLRHVLRRGARVRRMPAGIDVVRHREVLHVLGEELAGRGRVDRARDLAPLVCHLQDGVHRVEDIGVELTASLLALDGYVAIVEHRAAPFRLAPAIPAALPALADVRLATVRASALRLAPAVLALPGTTGA